MVFVARNLARSLLAVLCLAFISRGVDARVLTPTSAIGFENDFEGCGPGPATQDVTAELQLPDGVWAPRVEGCVTQNFFATGVTAGYLDAISLHFDLTGIAVVAPLKLRVLLRKGAYVDTSWHALRLDPGSFNPTDQDCAAICGSASVFPSRAAWQGWIERAVPMDWVLGSSLDLTMRIWNARVDAVQLEVPTGLSFAVEPSDFTVGAAVSPPVQVRVADDPGNALSGESVTLSLVGPGAPAGGGPVATDATGVATFADLSVSEVGVHQLMAESGSQVPTPSTTFKALDPSAVVCGTVVEDQVLQLSAPTGQNFTAVEFASYGTPTGSCDDLVVGSCHAGSSVAVVEALALGQTSVSIAASNSNFGDPCFGTVKRLSVRLRCGPIIVDTVSVDTTNRVVCGAVHDYEVLQLNAPAGQMFTAVEFASYGTPFGACSDWAIGSCHAESSLAVVEAAALGQTSVSISADPATFFEDPCVGTLKTLAVRLRYGPMPGPLFVVNPTDVVAGQSMVPAVQVRVLDSLANGIPNDDITLDLVGTGSLTGGGTVQTDATGVATFTGLSVDLAGAKTLTATSASYGSVASRPFTVSPGPPAAMAFEVQPTDVQAFGTMVPAVEVKVTDAFGNPLSGVSVSLALSGAGVLTGGGPVVTGSTGVATFGSLTIDESGPMQLVASGAGLTPVTSATFDVTPAPVGEIGLRWSNCEADGGTSNRTSACASNFGQAGAMIGSFVLTRPLTSVVTCEFDVDVTLAGSSVPAWWQLKNPGACRATALSISAFDGASCFDWAGGNASMNIASYTVGALGANSARIHGVCAVPASAGADLVEGTEYTMFRLNISNVNTSNCAGCDLAACISVASVTLAEIDGTRRTMSLPIGGDATRGRVTWQSTVVGDTPCDSAGFAIRTTVVGRGTVGRSRTKLHYPIGSPIELWPIPDPGDRFVAWSGDTTATADTLAIVVTRDRDFTATFARDSGWAAQVQSIQDVPGDEGGRVRVAWRKSPLDSSGLPGLCCYRVERQDPAAPGSPWASAGEVPATTADNYLIEVSSPRDSITGDPALLRYRVVTWAAADTFTWTSNEAEGYSVDNTPPPALEYVTGNIASGTAALFWPASGAADLGHYAVYRAFDGPPPADLEHRIGTTSVAGFNDAPGSFAYYAVTAVDVHGNEGVATPFVPANPADVDSREPPAALTLEAVAPVPARGRVSLTVGLPRAMNLTAVVLDPLGRTIRRLSDGPSPAGWQTLAWDGRDDGGNGVRPGVYFIQIRTPMGRKVARFLMLP